MRHTLRRLLARGEVIAGVVDEGPWFDLGTLERYAAVNFALASGALSWPGVVAPSDGIVAAPGADRSRLVAPCVVGAAVLIAPAVTVRRVIAWDGAVISQSVRDAVVTRRSVVPLPDALGTS